MRIRNDSLHNPSVSPSGYHLPLHKGGFDTNEKEAPMGLPSTLYSYSFTPSTMPLAIPTRPCISLGMMILVA